MKRISEWRKLKEAIAEKKTSATGKNRKRLSGGGCQPKDAGLQKAPMEQITKGRAPKVRVSQKLIMFKVKRLHKERVEEDPAEKNVLMAGRG